MIQNGRLMHSDPQNPLLVWRPSSLALYGLLVAFLATVLSYQAAALILDLCIGIKRPGRSRVSVIQTVLLVRSFSPLAFLYSLFPSLKRDANKHTLTNTQNASSRLRFLVVFKLVFLLVIIPAINIATIVFTLESTIWLTFADAKFGGLSFGVDPNLSTQPYRRSSDNCKKVFFVEGEGEDAMSEFLNCEITRASTSRVIGQWAVGVFAGPNNDLQVHVHGPSSLEVSARRAFVLVTGLGLEDPSVPLNGFLRSYQLGSHMTNESAERLVDYGLQMVKNVCRNREGADEFRNFSVPYNFRISGGRAAVFKLTNCKDSDPDEPETGGARKVLEELSNRISFIDHPRFDISATGGVLSTFISGQDLLLLRRRRSYVGVPILGIMTVAITILRMLVGCVTSNDVERGIGLIIRHGLGLRCCDSMLASSHVVADYKEEWEVTRLRTEVTCDD